MIISISRRTDIPAFYSPWLMSRLREGYTLVPHPRNPHQLTRVPLDPENAEFLVFWSKNPGPLLGGPLREIENRGYPFYFQFTLTPYGRDWEPGLPDKRTLIETFRELSRQAGPERVIWRYDPILLDSRWTAAAHRDAFRRMAEALSGFTHRCIFSFIDRYSGRAFQRIQPVGESDQHTMARAFADIAALHGIRLFTCCEGIDLSPYGIGHGACIDGQLISSLTGREAHTRKDEGQRDGCRCVQSADIGCYGCCPHGCRYCYANPAPEAVSKKAALHDRYSPLLIGRPAEDALITDSRKAPLFTGQTSLFE